MDELEQSADLPNSDAAHDAAAEEHAQQAENHDDQDDSASQEQAEEDEEIEIGGKKVAMPKSIAAEIKAGTMRNADYTQKTQAVAAERREVEAERVRVREEAQQQQQYLDQLAEVRAIDRQLKQYNDLNWRELSQNDPQGAQQLDFERRELEKQRNEAQAAITQKQSDYALNEQRALATQVQEAEAYVKREIPGCTPARLTELNNYATNLGVKVDHGFSRTVLQNPALLLIMDKAEKFDQLVKKQTAKPSTPAAPPPPVKRVGAVSASAKPDPAKMPTADWMEQRNKQLRGKR